MGGGGVKDEAMVGVDHGRPARSPPWIPPSPAFHTNITCLADDLGGSLAKVERGGHLMGLFFGVGVGRADEASQAE